MFDSETLRGALLRSAGACFVTLGLASVASAQAEPPPSFDLRVSYDSGLVANTGARRGVVISKTVHVAGADWMRVFFDSVELAGNPYDGEGSILRITSHKDGYVQELDSRHLREWRNSSAYFNGDTLQVDIEASPGTGTNRLVMDHVSASVSYTEKTQCGPVDNRQPSNDPRAARVAPIGCSVWMLDDCRHCFGTAGHCAGGSLSVVQFNVPLSNPNGSWNNPPPEDQYSVDLLSKQAVNGGVGNDWGYFGVFPNSNTGLTPFQAQGAAYQLQIPPPPFNGSQSIRITGYGTDSTPLTSNQIQQTHSGPWISSGGNALTYQADTTGGNSGSPVIHEETGDVIGVHTHGGCSTTGGGANAGTSTTNPGWQNALNNPKGVCKAGTPGPYCFQLLPTSVLGCFPTLSVSDLSLATGSWDTTNIPRSSTVSSGNTLGIYIYTNGPGICKSQFSQTLAFGTLCLQNFKRSAPTCAPLALPTTAGLCSTDTMSLSPSCNSGALGLAVGDDVNVQLWYRDPTSSDSGQARFSNAFFYTVQ